MAPPGIFVAGSGGKTFFVFAAGKVACKGFAGDDCRQDTTFGSRPLERLDLQVRPMRYRCCRRTENDEKLRGGKRSFDLQGEVVARGKIVLVAEDWAESPRDHPRRG